MDKTTKANNEAKTFQLTLTLNSSQADVLVAALEAYSRMQMGQVSSAIEMICVEAYFATPNEHVEPIRIMFESLKSMLFPDLPKGAYHGIHQPAAPETARTAWDVQQVLRHLLAHTRHPEGGHTVNFHDPSRSSNEHDLPTAGVVPQE